MVLSWIKKLFVKTQPVEPEPVVAEVSPARKKRVRKAKLKQPEPEAPEIKEPVTEPAPEPELQAPVVKKKRGRPFGSKNKGRLVIHLKTRPQIRKGERPSNYVTRVKRWEARNDPAKTKVAANTPGQRAGDMENSDKP